MRQVVSIHLEGVNRSLLNPGSPQANPKPLGRGTGSGEILW